MAMIVSKSDIQKITQEVQQKQHDEYLELINDSILKAARNGKRSVTITIDDSGILDEFYVLFGKNTYQVKKREYQNELQICW